MRDFLRSSSFGTMLVGLITRDVPCVLAALYLLYFTETSRGNNRGASPKDPPPRSQVWD